MFPRSLLFAGQPSVTIDSWPIPPAALVLMIGLLVLAVVGIAIVLKWLLRK
jgi:hypothetical protein